MTTREVKAVEITVTFADGTGRKVATTPLFTDPIDDAVVARLFRDAIYDPESAMAKIKAEWSAAFPEHPFPEASPPQ
jgi:hypothetical protein